MHIAIIIILHAYDVKEMIRGGAEGWGEGGGVVNGPVDGFAAH